MLSVTSDPFPMGQSVAKKNITYEPHCRKMAGPVFYKLILCIFTAA
jgi:hypothetical protein